MRTSFLSLLMIGGLASSTLVGCAREAKLDEAKLGRLPMEQKQDVFTAEHNMTVAQANKTAAERAKDDAGVFGKTANDEWAAAKARVMAARDSLELAHRTHDDTAIRTDEKDFAVANKMLLAAQAKRDYASKLVDLRGEEVGLADRQLDLAKAQLSIARINAIRGNGEPAAESSPKAKQELDQAQAQLAIQEHKIAAARDEVQRYRATWDERRRDFNVAAREIPSLPATQPPPAPERIPQRSLQREEPIEAPPATPPAGEPHPM